MKRVLGQNNQSKYKTAEDYTTKSLDNIEDENFIKETVAEKKTTASFATAKVDDEDDDDMSYFSKLIGDD